MLRDELLQRAALDTLLEASGAISIAGGPHYTIRPHRALGYRPALPSVAAPFVRMAFASANTRGWSISIR
ncbi:MAG: hypothetical protein DWH80_01325 [Planctomycetota bacterium]|nr:MAG: hypothetical protein DWH80_01325 [Planctomycetota bacterium]